jgi:hypothetical protein
MAVGVSPQISSQQIMTKPAERLVFLDVVRGLTVAFILAARKTPPFRAGM